MSLPPTSPGPAAGSDAVRREARQKAAGRARYAAEHTPPGCLHAAPVPATIARGRVTAVHADEILARPGVHAVLSHEDAPRLGDADDPTLALLQDDRVPHRGWYVALVVADTPENARAAADDLRVDYAPEEHDAGPAEGHPRLYTPEKANGGYPAVRERGDFDTAFADSAVRVDATYTMTALHNHPMEPHASTAWWTDGDLTVHDSSQGSTTVRGVLARLFGLPERRITVDSVHVGGGFGSKGTPRPQVVLAVMAALHTGRPVKLALPRPHLAAVVGHRAPTVQRVRIGADAHGVIRALAHEVTTQTSTVKEFVEQAAVPARTMYTSPHSRTTHRVVALDVPTPSWMRAPGEASGMYALESAM
ncbi:xanthine dehydrogenase family protein molybdopterin-binding subunit, partial [Streptomyces sp. NPDC058757]|uniref:xanthine dehydrogenase family protein molybdopterin-binding subunit n=1 Tax=Streptomyces sp. NPDC058757 TaxID=3346626 RepID=UPI00369781D1